MTLIHALILGIIEGITEFLPISSTAHLEIAARFLQITHTDFVKTFEIFIQLGAILAVVVLYFKTLSRNLKIWKRIIVAFIPTAVIGFILYKIIKTYILGNYIVIIWALFLGGIALIAFEFLKKDLHKIERDSTIRELESMSYMTAFVIGLAQALAVIPGVSRAAATIVAGRLLGVGKRAIVEFSFLLAVPTMLAAAGYDIYKTAPALTGGNIGILAVGFIAAFFSALVAVSFLINFVKSKSFTSFGIYRIILAIVLFFLW